MLALIHYRLRVTLNDSRILIGQMLAYDKHMNLVLAECEEFRTIKTKKRKGAEGGGGDEDGTGSNNNEQEIKRMLGLVILRGETIVSLSVEGPPPVTDDSKGPQILPGTGRGIPAGRGIGLAPPPGLMRGQAMPFARPPGGPPGMVPPQGMRQPGFPPGGMPGMPPQGFGGGPPPGFPGPPPGFPGPPPGFQMGPPR